MLRSWASWSKVMRQHLVELKRLGHSISSQNYKNDRYNPEFQLQEPLDSISELPIDPNPIAITYLPPSEYRHIDNKFPLVGFLVYEATRWPSEWVKQARNNLTHAIVPSKFNYNGLVESGFKRQNITIVPYGFNKKLYYPNKGKNEEEILDILFVGTPVNRKGLDILLRSITNAFDPEDNIRVTLKINPYSGDIASRPYVMPNWEQECLQLRNEGYNTRLIFRLLPETDLSTLYREADVLCLPTRGEGFGLTLLEAMACGTPPLVTKWGGQLDFVNESNSFLLSNYNYITANNDVLSDPPSSSTDSKMVDPDETELSNKLRHLYDNPAELQKISENTSKSVDHLTWEKTTQTLAETLASCIAGHPEFN